MRLHPSVFGVLALAIFLGTIVTAQATGNWSVSGKVTTAGEKIAATGSNPDEIKGWMTLKEVITAYGVSIDELVEVFELPMDTSPEKQIKELESNKFSPTILREWLKTRMNTK